MKTVFTLIFSVLNTLLLSAQNNNETYVVRLNHKLLNYRIVDNPSITKGKIIDFLSSSELEKIDTSSYHDEKFNLLELDAVKMFPHLYTKDSLSVGRQGNLVYMPPFWATFKIKKPEGISSSYFFRALKNCYPIVIFVDSPMTLKLFDIPNDSLFIHQESLHNFTNTGADINIDSAWNIETGKKFIKVGVFDSGIDSLHPDLDVLGGYSYFYDEIDLGNGTIGHSWGQDLEGHGTRVAGIIGAKRNNGIGIAGIAGGNNMSDSSGVSLLDFNLGFNEDYGYALDANDIAQAVIDAARVPYTYYNWDIPTGSSATEEYYWSNAPGYGIYVGNHSYGLEFTQSPPGGGGKDLPGGDDLPPLPPTALPECYLCREAFLFSLQNGVSNVVSRGNNFNSNNLYTPNWGYPQLYDDSWVISVGASGEDGNRYDDPTQTWRSPIGLNLDLIAPGISSLVSSTASSNVQDFPTYGWYRGFSGTSASAPHVTGVAALLMSYYNKPCYSNINLDPADIEYILQKSATAVSTPVPNDSVGYGRLNAYEALKMINFPEFQIVHPNDLFTQQQVLAVDTITIKLDKPLNPLGNGPLGSPFPLILEQTYLVERHKYELTYNFGQYIQDSTTLLDTWVRHSQTNSLMELDDTISILTGQPVPVPVFHLDSFQIEPMAQIESILNDSIITLTGYYYHFIKRYSNNDIQTAPPFTVNYWYPINPYSETPKMAYSIYIRDNKVTRYDFPCDADNPLLDSTLNTIQLNVNEFNIFPNPATQELNVSFSDVSTEKTIELVDISGKIMDSQIIRANQSFAQFNVGNLSKGLYLVKISTKNNGVLTKKWIKQ